MQEQPNWTQYLHWHELLDALCTERGFIDNMALADALCAAGGNRSQAAFDTAVKNLRNWRIGAHVPRRKNFILLSKILQVDSDGDLRAQWLNLYAQTRSRPDMELTASPIDTENVQRNLAKPNAKVIWAGAAMAAVLVVGLSVWALLPNAPTAQDDPVASYEGIVAEYVRNVSARVGDSLIIHGARGDECGDAPSWEVAKELLPDLVTGTLADGGVGTRLSRQCGGRIPARAIMFTATTPGTEQISLYGDDIVIRVTN